jgi:dihydropteroate synthase-like protein
LSDSAPTPAKEKILFITGRLAEPLVEKTVKALSEKHGFDYEIYQIGVQVAALMHVDLILNRLKIPEGITQVMLPGWVQGDLHKLIDKFQIPFVLGPKTIVELPEYFGGTSTIDLSAYNIEIIAEINHAPRYQLDELEKLALYYQSQGANRIDIGCIPGMSWTQIGDAVTRLRQHGLQLSIDSFDRTEVEAGVKAGADLVLSCNSTNREWAIDLPAEFVIIPDIPAQWEQMEETIEVFEKHQRPYRLDPILEPIAFGFGASLLRYAETRARWPQARMMMGIGNVTELSEVDSSGVNLILLALCEEWNITSILTTQVAPWTQSCIKEIALGRQLIHFALNNKRLPKRLGQSLLMLRDPRRHLWGEDYFAQLAAGIKDPNFRIFAEAMQLHIINRNGHWTNQDPFALFAEVLKHNTIDPAHAFYLGYEISKAMTALTLGKNYRQDQALNWGLLTIPETSSHEYGNSREKE